MAGVVEVTGLAKSWGGRAVLRIPQLVLESGSSYVLSGDNGAGKSTLLRILAGLEPAPVERFAFQGTPWQLDRLPAEVRRQIGFVHQHPYMFGRSALANVEYGLRVRGIPRNERVRLAREALGWAGMAELANAPAQRLSGGEQQRIALARMKVLSPRVYLLDEPTANLDADGRARVIELIAQLAAADKVVVIACHDLEMINLPGVVRLHLENGSLEGEANALRAVR
ncbi:MAG TPA: ABC transporter ATP-binding protein [Burkholderiales bacterium]|nr:ABC transporter ATP-binding protein [Burkholderiales bacterium]